MLWKTLSSLGRYVSFVVYGLAKSGTTCKNTDMAEQLWWFTAAPKKHFYVVGLKLCAFRRLWQVIARYPSLCMKRTVSSGAAQSNTMSSCGGHTCMFISLSAKWEQFIHWINSRALCWACRVCCEALYVVVLIHIAMTINTLVFPTMLWPYFYHKRAVVALFEHKPAFSAECKWGQDSLLTLFNGNKCHGCSETMPAIVRTTGEKQISSLIR